MSCPYHSENTAAPSTVTLFRRGRAALFPTLQSSQVCCRPLATITMVVILLYMKIPETAARCKVSRTGQDIRIKAQSTLFPTLLTTKARCRPLATFPMLGILLYTEKPATPAWCKITICLSKGVHQPWFLLPQFLENLQMDRPQHLYAPPKLPKHSWKLSLSRPLATLLLRIRHMLRNTIRITCTVEQSS